MSICLRSPAFRPTRHFGSTFGLKAQTFSLSIWGFACLLLVAFVMDNGAYAFMSSTFTTRRTDLAKMAQGAGIANAGTVKTLEEFSAAAKQAMESTGPTFIVAKVERDAGRVPADRSRTSGRPMREWFMDVVRRHPDYKGKVG